MLNFPCEFLKKIMKKKYDILKSVKHEKYYFRSLEKY